MGDCIHYKEFWRCAKDTKMKSFTPKHFIPLLQWSWKGGTLVSCHLYVCLYMCLSVLVWHTCANALAVWVLYRQLELTKLTRPDLHHVVGLFILRDVRLSVDKTVSTLYLPQYLSDPFHMCTSYQACARVIAKLQNLNFWQIFVICNFDCLFMTWDLMWIASMGNPGAAGGISERRHFSCSSFGSLVIVRLLIESFLCLRMEDWVWGGGVVGHLLSFHPSVMGSCPLSL